MFLKNSCMRSMTNTYILSLALADLLVLVTCVPFIAVGYTLEYWVWGSTICKFAQSSKDVFTVVSVYTLVALSALRYTMTMDPLKKFVLDKSRAFRASLLIWALACVAALPTFFYSDVQYVELGKNNSVPICTPFPDVAKEKCCMLIWVVCQSILFYILPLFTILGNYVMIARRLRSSAEELVGVFNGARKVAKVRIRVAGLLLVFVIVFVLCFLPYQVFGLWFHFQPTNFDDYHAFRKVIKIAGFCLSFLNACINPIALYCLSGAFRQHNRMKCLCVETCCLLIIYFQLCAVSKLNDTF